MLADSATEFRWERALADSGCVCFYNTYDLVDPRWTDPESAATVVDAVTKGYVP